MKHRPDTVVYFVTHPLRPNSGGKRWYTNKWAPLQGGFLCFVCGIGSCQHDCFVCVNACTVLLGTSSTSQLANAEVLVLEGCMGLVSSACLAAVVARHTSFPNVTPATIAQRILSPGSAMLPMVFAVATAAPSLHPCWPCIHMAPMPLMMMILLLKIFSNKHKREASVHVVYHTQHQKGQHAHTTELIDAARDGGWLAVRVGLEKGNGAGRVQVSRCTPFL